MNEKKNECDFMKEQTQVKHWIKVDRAFNEGNSKKCN